MKSYESITDALNDLRKRGYEADFETQTICLYCGDLDIRLDPEDFHVDEVYRFQGDSNPDDNAIIYAISSSTGVKGIIIDGYGASSEHISFEIAKKLRNHQVMLNS